MSKPKLPVILYEESKTGEAANPIPYIEVGMSEEMPSVLFISEYKETGEYEPDPQFGSRPIVDMLIHKYVDLDHLKTKLDEETYDKIRVALGMKPLKQAQQSGQQILNKVFAKAELNKSALENNEDAKLERTFKLGENMKNKLKLVLEQSKDQEDKK
jgi:glutamate formiminotransferase